MSAGLSPSGAVDTLPPRPRGKWRGTYEARLQELWRIKAKANVAFAERVGWRLPGLRLVSIPWG